MKTELPQAIEKVLAFKSERAQMLSVDLRAVAQPVAVGWKRGIFRYSSKVPLISAKERWRVKKHGGTPPGQLPRKTLGVKPEPGVLDPA
ncbi:hypothetical protein TNCT_392181 [Trichonephila clavata]|uniref:Uncharacterized protein n=1 Tax=Trichonephila clavata TaxID=2740835 RepID=A0A8X6KHF9_TRICU|nr:hypothetical protein TNCT_392181 [Trichonephila clavata]